MGIFDSLPTLGDMPRGGWPKEKPEPSRLQAKEEKKRDEKKEEAAWKKAVWTRDESECRWCRRAVRKRLDLVADRGEVHHVSGRVVRAIRWDVRNGLLLCATCHERLTGKVAEKHVVESKHTFAVDGVQYVNASKAVRFRRVV